MTNENLDMLWSSLDEVQKEMFLKLMHDLDDEGTSDGLYNDIMSLMDEANFSKSNEEKLVEKEIKNSTDELKKANAQLKKEVDKSKKDVVNANVEELQKLKSVQDYQNKRKHDAEELRDRINKLQQESDNKKKQEKLANKVRKEVKEQKELNKIATEADKIIDLKNAKLAAEKGNTKKSRLSEFSERLGKLQ